MSIYIQHSPKQPGKSLFSKMVFTKVMYSTRNLTEPEFSQKKMALDMMVNGKKDCLMVMVKPPMKEVRFLRVTFLREKGTVKESIGHRNTNTMVIGNMDK